jgi:hypothetical protein
MGTSMKTMLGGWEDVSRLLAQQARAPQESRSQPARPIQRSGSCKTRVGGLSVPLPPLPAPERLTRTHAMRQRASTRPAFQAASASAPRAAPVPRWALDDTCEIREEDLVLLMRQPLPHQPSTVPHGRAGLRRGGTLLEPALHIIPVPTRGLARPSLVQRVVRWAKLLLARR